MPSNISIFRRPHIATWLALATLAGAGQTHADSACLPGNENPNVASSTPTARFELTSALATEDGIVRHRSTRLEWMRCALGQQWNGASCVGGASLFTWAQALQAAASSNHGGFADWRLPSRSELASIVEVRCFSPAINVAAFPQTPSLGFVSASPHGELVDPATAGTVWMVAFDDGDVIADQTSQSYHVRLVRGGGWEP